MKRSLYIAIAAFLLAASPGPIPSSVASAAQPSPAATVQGFHETLLNVMRSAPRISVKQRFKRLLPAVHQAFDLDLMTKIASGPAWQKADPTERKKLTEAFQRFSTAFYASRFTGGPGTHFDLVGVKPGPGDTKLVSTELRLPNHDAVKLVYVVRQDATTGNWQIVDVLLDGGISQLAQRRSEYYRIASNEGASGLVRALNQKADQLLTQQ